MLKCFIALLLSLPSFALGPILETFNEKPFPTDEKKLESYRFTYLPTFDKPYLFRLDVTSATSGLLTIKRLSGKGGYELGTVELDKPVPLTGHSFQSLLKKLREPKVWKPFGGHPERDDLLKGTDGEIWFLEGLRNGVTTVAKVSNPDMVPRLGKLFNLEEGTEFSTLLETVNPFFQAAYSFLKTAAPHYTWERGVHEQLHELRKTSAIFKSSSYRAAIEILERKKPQDPSDPFSLSVPIPPTSEERLKAHALLKNAIRECPENPEPFFSLFSSYFDIENFAAAALEIQKARKLAPEDHHILFWQGVTLARLLHFAEATEIQNLLLKDGGDWAARLEEEILRIRSSKNDPEVK